MNEFAGFLIDMHNVRLGFWFRSTFFVGINSVCY